jgi:hypothetical protein
LTNPYLDHTERAAQLRRLEPVRICICDLPVHPRGGGVSLDRPACI